MKVKVVSTLLLILSFYLKGYSQIEKGTVLLSGKTDLNFLFSNTETSRDSITTNKTKGEKLGVTITAGYFIADNLTLILSGVYSYAYHKTEPVNNLPGRETITSTVGVIPQISYYFPLDGKLKPSVSIGAGYLFRKERDSREPDNNNTVYSLRGPSYNGSAGLSYFISPSISFDLGFQYTYNRLKNKLQTNEIEKQQIVAGVFGVTVFL